MVNPSVVIRGVALVIPVVLLGFLFNTYSVDYAPEALKEWADTRVRGEGLAGVLLFIAAGAAFTAMGLSRQVLAFVGGYVFGLGAGTAYALAGEMAGVLLGFLYARYLARDIVARRFPGRVRKIDDFLCRHPFSMTLAVRLFPASNNLVVNLLAGVSSVPVTPFLAASSIGHLPQTLVFALVGSGVATGDLAQAALAAVLFAISTGIGWYLYRKSARGRALVEDVDADAAGERA